jgi:hypothetical protein
LLYYSILFFIVFNILISLHPHPKIPNQSSPNPQIDHIQIHHKILKKITSQLLQNSSQIHHIFISHTNQIHLRSESQILKKKTKKRPLPLCAARREAARPSARRSTDRRRESDRPSARRRAAARPPAARPSALPGLRAAD